ncbi:RNA polymerase sigma factor [Streptomyces tsukubensis]
MEELVTRAGLPGPDGDEAFAALYGDLGDVVYSWIRRYIRDEHTAEDLAQEVWVKVSRNIGKYRPGTNFLAWLSTITQNTAKDYLRSIQRRPVEVLQADQLDLDRPKVGQSPEEYAEKRMVAEAVATHMGKLRPDQRQVLLLRFFDGLSPGQAAQLMNKTDGAVRTLTVRSLRRLRQAMPPGDSAAQLIEELLTAAVAKRRVIGTRVEIREARANVTSR